MNNGTQRHKDTKVFLGNMKTNGLAQRILSLCLCLFVLVLASCSSYFDETGDDKTITSDRFFQDESAFLSALTDVYTQLRAEHLYGNTLTVGLLEFAAGDFVPFDDITSAAAAHRFDNPAVAQLTDSMALAAYRAVASCNKIIEEAESSDVVFFNSGQKKIILGECYALRAALQFDLLRLYHPHPSEDADYRGLPYVTRFGEEDLRPLSTSEFLKAADADLRKAEALLKDHDPALRESSSSTIVGKIDRRLRTLQMNYYAVRAVEARVALWKGDGDRVLECARDVMSHDSIISQRNRLFYFMSPGKYAADYCFSREFIFGIATLPGGFTSLCDRMFREHKIAVNGDIHTIYPDAADTRYRAWFRQQTDGTYSMQQKFSSDVLLTGYVVSSTGSASDLPASIPYIKIGEVALMAAEVLCKKEQMAEALKWVQLVEDNRGVSDAATMIASGTADNDAVMTLIRQEYRRELFGEGQLFFFNKRLGDTSLMLPLPKNLLKQ